MASSEQLQHMEAKTFSEADERNRHDKNVRCCTGTCDRLRIAAPTVGSIAAVKQLDMASAN